MSDDIPEIHFDRGARALRPRDIRLTGRGFVFGEGVAQLEVRWMTLVELSAVEPWPEIEVGIKEFGAAVTRRFRPRFAKDSEEFAVKIEELFAHTAKHLPSRVTPGWLAYPDVCWELVGDFPDESESAVGVGAYRSAARAPTIIARRTGPTSIEFLLAWLASGPGWRWRAHPGEIALTEDFLYARHHDGNVYRLPLDTLRQSRPTGSKPNDQVFFFGRRLIVVLPHRDECPVATELNQRLAQSVLGSTE